MEEKNFDDSVRRKKLAGEYADMIHKRNANIVDSLTAEQYKFFLNYGDYAGTKIYAELDAAMRREETVPSEYVENNLSWLFEKAVPKRELDCIKYFADRLCEFPYSDTYARRSFRSADKSAYAVKLVNLIRTFGHGFSIDAPIGDVLNRRLPEAALAYLDVNTWQGGGYSSWQVAYALDMHDESTEEAVRRILTEENGTGALTASLVRGVLCSKRGEFHELLGKLLLAARLQEGLRQVICESADCGTKEGFMAILSVIAENDLIRFSSVKRAVGTWLGIMTDESRDLERVSGKSVRLALECLKDEKAREAYLGSEDAMEIYISLWSYGFFEVDEAIEKIAHIAENGTHHQLLVAGYFTQNLEFDYIANNISKRVLRLFHEEDDILAVWLPCFLKSRIYTASRRSRLTGRVEYERWFKSKDEICEFYAMARKLYADFKGKTKTFSPCVFPWYEAKLEKSDLAEIICTLAVLSGDKEKLDESYPLIKECVSHRRSTCFEEMLRNPQTPVQRRAALEGIADKESYTRRSAFKIVSGMKLTAEEYAFLEGYLRFKSQDIRNFLIELLLKQGDGELKACIFRMLANGKEEIRVAALDMILQLKKDEKRSALAECFAEALCERARAENLSTKEKAVLSSLLPEEKGEAEKATALFTEKDKYYPTEFDAEYTALCAETFAEYFPESKLPALIGGKKKRFGISEKIKSAFSGNAPCKDAVTAAEDLVSLSRFIEEHKTVSYVRHNGDGNEGIETIISNVTYKSEFRDMEGKAPLRELWQEWIDKNSITKKRIVNAAVMFFAYDKETEFAEICAEYIKDLFGNGFEKGKPLPYSVLIGILFDYLCSLVPREERLRLASALTLWFMTCVPDENVMILGTDNNTPVRYRAGHLLAHSQMHLLYAWLDCKNDEFIKYTFPLAAASAERCMAAYKRLPEDKAQDRHLYFSSSRGTRCLYAPYELMYGGTKKLTGVNEYLVAAYRGVITKAQLYEFLLSPDNIYDTMSVVSAVAGSVYEKGKEISEHDEYRNVFAKRRVEEFLGKRGEPDEDDLRLVRFVTEVYETVVPIVVYSELARGDSPAKYSDGIRGISRIYGAKYLADILAAMGNDTIDRIANYGWSMPNGRKGSLSYLLLVCIPSDGDSEETLKAALEGKKISKRRLIEAALFSPEWIPIIGKYLGQDSFESVCYYFMAHMNEKFDDKRRAMIAKFTPLSEDELNLGAFDVNWFRTAYGSIAEEEFELIYDAAKYISDGAKHSRARKYADAALGRFDAAETEKTISDKRNKDLLMAYALIPLENEEELCRRYLYIQRFRKESKQFGSQRIASEAKAVEMALTNLASNAGYSDTMRLTLRMETKVIDDSRELLAQHTVEGVAMQITIDENGKASLTCAKEGKALKSVPAKLKKHETVLALTEMVKTLNEQYRRTRVMLEKAMEESTGFTFGELRALASHPVVYPMLKNLVLAGAGKAGFLAEGGLSDAEGRLIPMEENESVKIAHPFDLYVMGCWRSYQKYLFENKITQPFRQVFRELYVKTEEERGALHSLRYAGNQIQPAKTVGALKSRRWVADVEDGLQKVYYKENIIAQIYAMADWFSPADIEAPTLEWVCFSDRRTGAAIKIADIPDVIFSEVMRDVDLAVSVAHAGGVDPEASHSTMEMRAAILSFVLPMFRIENVKLQGNHAIVNGKLADYSVHLGSGVVHQLGGAMIPVLPVHSQHRGKVFLPFVDDDPKTSEVISKVLLFAEDGKIKDPMILSCIEK